MHAGLFDVRAIEEKVQEAVDRTTALLGSMLGRLPSGETATVREVAEVGVELDRLIVVSTILSHGAATRSHGATAAQSHDAATRPHGASARRFRGETAVPFFDGLPDLAVLAVLGNVDDPLDVRCLWMVLRRDWLWREFARRCLEVFRARGIQLDLAWTCYAALSNARPADDVVSRVLGGPPPRAVPCRMPNTCMWCFLNALARCARCANTVELDAREMFFRARCNAVILVCFGAAVPCALAWECVACGRKYRPDADVQRQTDFACGCLRDRCVGCTQVCAQCGNEGCLTHFRCGLRVPCDDCGHFHCCAVAYYVDEGDDRGMCWDTLKCPELEPRENEQG